MIRVHTLVVQVQFVENHVRWRAHFEREVDGNVLEAKVTKDKIRIKNIY